MTDAVTCTLPILDMRGPSLAELQRCLTDRAQLGASTLARPRNRRQRHATPHKGGVYDVFYNEAALNILMDNTRPHLFVFGI